MRCLKVITLLCVFSSLSMLSAAIDTDDELRDKFPTKLRQKLPNRNTFPILPLENLSHVWNARRHLYNRIGSLPLVTAFDKDLKKLLIKKQRAEQSYPDLEIAIKVWQLSTKHIIPIFQEGLEPDTAEGFILKIASLDTSLETYINDVHSLYLQYLSKL